MKSAADYKKETEQLIQKINSDLKVFNKTKQEGYDRLSMLEHTCCPSRYVPTTKLRAHYQDLKEKLNNKEEEYKRYKTEFKLYSTACTTLIEGKSFVDIFKLFSNPRAKTLVQYQEKLKNEINSLKLTLKEIKEELLSREKLSTQKVRSAPSLSTLVLPKASSHLSIESPLSKTISPLTSSDSSSFSKREFLTSRMSSNSSTRLSPIPEKSPFTAKTESPSDPTKSYDGMPFFNCSLKK